jgi:hypothetical protein
VCRSTPKRGQAFTKLGELGAYGDYSTASPRKSLLVACKALKVPPIHPHVLRHSFASWLVNEGKGSLKTAQKMLEAPLDSDNFPICQGRRKIRARGADSLDSLAA